MAKRTITFHGSDKSGEPPRNHELQRLCNMMHRKKLLSRPSIACNGFPGGNHIGEDHLPLPRTDSAIQINLEVPWKSSKLDVNPVLARKLLCSNFEPMLCAVLSRSLYQPKMQCSCTTDQITRETRFPQSVRPDTLLQPSIMSFRNHNAPSNCNAPSIHTNPPNLND